MAKSSRSRSLFSRKSQSSARNQIENLPPNVLDQLTKLLYMNTQIDVLSPPRFWLNAQKEQAEQLDKTLLCPPHSSIIQGAFFRKFALFASKYGLPNFSKTTCLCSFHKTLHPRVIRTLLELIAKEVTSRVYKYREYREKHDLGPVLDAWLYRLESVLAIWMGRYSFERRLAYEAPPNCTGRIQRCEACILSFVGGRPQLLSDLRANLLARASAKILRGAEDPEPKLLRVIDSWIKWYEEECRVAINSASYATSQHIQVLDRELEAKKWESDKKRKQHGKKPRRRRYKKMERDACGLPIPTQSLNQYVTKKLYMNEDPSLTKIEGYVDCTIMSREGDYKSDSGSSVTQDQQRLYREKKKKLQKIMAGELPLFSDDEEDGSGDEESEIEVEAWEKKLGKKSIWEVERERDEGRYVDQDEYEEGQPMTKQDWPLSNQPISSGMNPNRGDQEGESEWVDASVYTYDGPSRSRRSGGQYSTATRSRMMGSEIPKVPTIPDSHARTSKVPVGDTTGQPSSSRDINTQPAPASSFYSGTHSITTTAMPYLRQVQKQQQRTIIPRRSGQDIRAEARIKQSVRRKRSRDRSNEDLSREALRALEEQDLKDKVSRWNRSNQEGSDNGGDQRRKRVAETVATESLIGMGRRGWERNC